MAHTQTPFTEFSNCWRTVLVSGLRQGGQGYFALDVTNPNKFVESKADKLVMWEFTDADDPDLGYSFSQASIVQMQNGRWAAVFGNGYNNSMADAHPSSSGNAVLFIVYLNGGLDGAWIKDTDYIKIDTGKGSPSTPNGLHSPATADLDSDLKVDYIYAGDLRGNVWKFDVTDSNHTSWADQSNWEILSTATSSSGQRQAITSRPQVGEHPDDPKGLMVYFGTGKYLEDPDNTVRIATQTFYGIADRHTGAVKRDTLLEQEVLNPLEAENTGPRITTDHEIDWSPQGHNGWYIDLPTKGERQVSTSILRNRRIIFTTLIPNTTICEFGGDAWLFELNAHSGSRLEDSPFDLNDDEEFNEDDKISLISSGGGKSTKVAASGLKSTEGILPTPTVLFSNETELKYSSGSSGGIHQTTENPGTKSRGRQAWRQFN